MEKLTVEKLTEMEPGTIFARGEIIDSPLGVNLEATNKMLRWAAVRGDIGDWAIYAHYADKSEDYVLRRGEKIHWEGHIRKLVPCDDFALMVYRH